MKNLRHKEVVSKRKKPEKEVDNFDPTKYGEASEKTHSASNQTQLGLNGHLKTTLISIPLMLYIKVYIHTVRISPSRPFQCYQRLLCQRRYKQDEPVDSRL